MNNKKHTLLALFILVASMSTGIVSAYLDFYEQQKPLHQIHVLQHNRAMQYWFNQENNRIILEKSFSSWA